MNSFSQVLDFPWSVCSKSSKKRFSIKTPLFLCVFLFWAMSLSAFGIIESFAPASGPVGSTVTITGYGFSTTAANNIVYFGTVKGDVISASADEIKVKVPAGASYRPLSVTSGGLTSYSRLPFVPTFQSAGSEPSYISFLPKEILQHSSKPFSIASADFDGDGKPDLAVADSITSNYFTVTLAVYKNTSIGGNTSFSDRQTITAGITANGNNSDLICIADIDGDGKLDIAVSKNGNVAWVFRNTSSNGQISFDEGHSFQVELGLYQTGVINVGDLNFDGKPDLMTGTGRSSAFSVLLNNSTPGSISFQDNIVFNIGNWGISRTDVFEVTAADFTGDAKPDLIISAQEETGLHMSKAKIIILANTTTLEGLSFSLEGSQSLPGFLLYKLTVADFNSDGLADIVCKFNDEAVFHVLKNTSAYLTTSWDLIDFPAPYETVNISAADVDGDGKPDIVLNKNNAVSVYKNLSAEGSVAFDESLDFKSNGVKYLSLGDINLDGKPDILCANTDENTFSILKNSGLWSGVKYVCPDGSGSLIAYTKGLSYQWQISTDSGTTFTNISNNEFYGGTTADKLLLTSISSSFYGYQYRCLVDGVANSEVYELKFTNIWLGTYDSDWGNAANWSCGAVPDANTDVEVGTGSISVNGNYSCRSLKISPASSVTVSSGSNLTITH